MTQTKNTVQKAKTTSAKASGKASRDAYDDFLDLTEKAPKARSGAAKGSATGKKTTSTMAKKASGGVASGGKKATAGTSSTGRKTAAGTKGAGGSKPKAKGSTRAPKAPKPTDLLAAWEELSEPGGTRTSASKRPSEPRKPGASRAPSKPNSFRAPSKPRTGAPRGMARPSRARNAVLYVDNQPGRDPFDDYLDATEGKRPAKRSGKKRGSGVTAVLIIAIVCVLGIAGWQTARYRNFLVMKSAVDRQGFYEGTTVEGVDVSNMTLAQALDHWRTQIEPGYAQRTVALSNGASFTAAELGYSSDYETVLTNAWSAGRSGSLEERYAMISARRDRPVSYMVTRSAYNGETLAQCAQAIAAQIDRPAQNAKIQSFDPSNYQFTFSDEVVGSKLDADALAKNMAQALDAGGGTVELEVQAIQPSVRKEEIASQYGMVASAVTNASSSSSNRLTNIRLALEKINGLCLKPGETFSFNTVVGKRTTERGFKVATAYSSGEVTEEVGGGICQVSTTLFNAAVKADLEIVERHNHSLTVGYVDKGKDAAVNWNSQDLRFTNNSEDDIYICCFLSDDKRVRVGVFGKLLPNGEYITVEGETTGTINFETVYQPNLGLPSGVSQVTRNGKNGYTAVAYKIRWDAGGNEISRVQLCKSTYKAVSQVVEYGP